MRLNKEACRAFPKAAVTALLVACAAVPAAVAQAPATTGSSGLEALGSSRPVTAAPEQVAPPPAEQPVASPRREPPARAPDTPAPRASEPQVPEPRATAPEVPPAESLGASVKEDAAAPVVAPGGKAPGDRADDVQPGRPRLVVSSWAGAYGAAQVKAVIAPLEGEMDIEIDRRARTDESDIAGADVVELGQDKLIEACRAGRLLPLSEWPKEDARGVGAAAVDDAPGDFFVETGGGCGLPSFAWSSILVANTETMKKLAGRRYREPAEIADLLDVGRFPGPRALIDEPRRVLEMMLLASGVERDQVYRTLATRRGEDRAFEALDGLGSSIVWVGGAREAMAALDDGRATMAMVFSGRAFRRLVAGEFKPIWDGHIMDFVSWAVPRDSRKSQLAVAFIRRALEPERLAEQARLWPYGPMRRSAVEAARRHALLEAELDQFMPTSGLRFGQGIVRDAEFWAENGERLAARFADWRAGVPLGIRVPPPRRAPPPPLPPLPRRVGVN